MSATARCPKCDCYDVRVNETTERSLTFRGRGFHVIRRHRICRHCQWKWYTLERNEEEILVDEPEAKLGEPMNGASPDNPYI